VISKNASVLNHEVQKYVNWIIKKVYKVPSHSIKTFDCDLSTTPTDGNSYIEDSFSDGKFTFRSVLNGIPYRTIFLLKNYLYNFYQTKLEKTYNLPINNQALWGGEGLSAVVTADGFVTLTIKVPNGFDGNLSFVKVTTDWYDADPVKNLSRYDSLVRALNTTINKTSKTYDAILYYGHNVNSGQFGVEIAKARRTITISVNTTGIESLASKINAHFFAKVTYFKRGLK